MKGRRAAMVAVAVLALVVSAPSLRYGFVFDEQLLVRDNPAVHDLTDLGAVLFTKFWPGPTQGIYWRPLVTLSYAIDYALVGEAPWLYHLTNVLLHAGAAVLLYLLLLRFTGAGVALAAALIFAIHPAHVESVTWVPGRTDVIAALFLAAAWLALLQAREAQARPRRAAWWGAAMGLYFCALGGKESAAVLPALVITADALRSGRGLKKHALDYLGLVAVTAGYLLIRRWVLAGPGSPPAADPLAELGLMRGLAAGGAIFGEAARVTILPGPWRIDYAYEDAILGGPYWRAAAAAIFLAAWAVAAVAWRRDRPALALTLIGFIAALLPVSHLVAFPNLFAERFLYLPSLFLIVGAVELGDHLWSSRSSGRPRAVVICALLMLLGIAGMVRGKPFRNELTFWRSAARQAPDKAAVHNWLGLAYRNRGDLPGARKEYERALALDPGLSVGAMNLAEIKIKEGDLEGAAAILKKLRADDPDNPAVPYNLGIVNAGQGDWKDARENWEAALKLDPKNLNAHLALLRFHLKVTGDCAEARRQLEAARALAPREPMVEKFAAEFKVQCP
jgi:protein O-mannosyl-transferase